MTENMSAPSNPPHFLEELVDEEDEGSEIDDTFDSGDEGEVFDILLQPDMKVDIEDMQVLSQSPGGDVYPLSPPCETRDSEERDRSPLRRSISITPPPYSPLSSPRSYHTNPDWSPPCGRASSEDRTRSPPCETRDSEERDRSPLRRSISITPPPYSPLSSPSLIVEFREGRSEDMLDTSTKIPRDGGRSSGRGRGNRGYRGGQRYRTGANLNVSRYRTSAATAVNGESKWRKGEPVLEVCLDDDDVPPTLRDMVYDLENSRRVRDEQQVRREWRRNIREDEGSGDENDFFDAESSVAQELFGGDSGALEFEWSPMATFNGHAEKFLVDNPGPNVIVTTAYDAFRQFWDDGILEQIVLETNRYAEGLKSTSERFASTWYDTNVHEIMVLFAFWMMLGIIRMPSIRSCFSTHPLLKTPIFSSMMTEARYWTLNRALHFVDNSTRTANSSKLFCLGTLLDKLNRNFQKAYTPSQNIAIDESLTLWKGNLSFKQYIKSKTARFGIKTFELCESSTGYLWNFFIYTGKDSEAPCPMQKSTEVVVKLIKPLLNRGHRLFMDNWFNSPLLARYLKRNKTDCIGTLRKSRKNIPAIVQLASLQEGTCVARHSGDVVVMAYQDKKTVYTISTCHGTESVKIDAKRKPAYYRPAVIADYNISMGGVDKKDQMLEPYLIERKRNLKWYKKMFKRILNVSIFNSRILVDKSSETPLKTQAFRLKLVSAILQEHLTHVPKPRTRADRAPDIMPDPNKRLAPYSHFLARIPPPIGSRNPNANLSGRRLCQWCLKRHGYKKKTAYFCETCGPALCLDECFRLYHTKP